MPAQAENDLSRGALVDDIVFTIALTALQADRTGGKLEAYFRVFCALLEYIA